jgi:dolichol kinase
VVLALLLFPSKIAYASIAIVAIGDPVAAYVGTKLGRTHVRRTKTMEGWAAGLIASFLLTSLIVGPIPAFVGSIGGMVMELVDIPDDNLTMPLTAGALMLLAAKF